MHFIDLQVPVGFVDLLTCFVEMGISAGMKLLAAVLVVALYSVPSVWSVAVPSAWSSDGHITFYGSANGQGTQGGACAYQNTFALGYGTMTAALSTPLFNGGAACGACYEIKCKQIVETNIAKNWCYSYTRSIIVTATNLCPPGSEGTWCDPPRHHFDLPMPAFLTLAKQQGGVAPVYYRRVPCSRKGGIRFTLGGNPWFFMILIHNVGGAGDVISVKVKCPYSGWLPMYRNWGSLWTVQYQLKDAMSFQLTLGNGAVVTVTNAVGNGWKFGQTWEANNNAR